MKRRRLRCRAIGRLMHARMMMCARGCQRAIGEHGRRARPPAWHATRIVEDQRLIQHRMLRSAADKYWRRSPAKGSASHAGVPSLEWRRRQPDDDCRFTFAELRNNRCLWRRRAISSLRWRIDIMPSKSSLSAGFFSHFIFSFALCGATKRWRIGRNFISASIARGSADRLQCRVQAS